MKKISTLFKKNPQNLGLVINEINPENEWVFSSYCIAMRKFDGTAACIMGGELYKRYDVKKGRHIPPGAISCQEPDSITGHHPHWVKCDRNKLEDKYFFEAFDKLIEKRDATYELCGEKVQGNPENITGHKLIPHIHSDFAIHIPGCDFESLKQYLSDESNDIEGIVFHEFISGRMCKIRKSDFGIKRKKKAQ